MESRFQLMMGYLEEIKNLKRKYPAATAFKRLSELYPNYTFDKDLVVALKKDYLGTKIHIFEEKDIAGTIDTSIIPIEYHSSYASAVAQVMRECIGQNEDFFRAFFKDYNRIVVDSTYHSDNGDLVIRNYAVDIPIEGYSINNFIEAILSEYNIDLQRNSELVGVLAKTQQDTDESVYAKPPYSYIFTQGNIPFETLANYYAVNGKYADLKYLLENKNDPLAINRHIILNDSIGFLNAAIDNMPEVISKNIDMLKPAVDETALAVKNGTSFENDFSSVSCDKETTISLVKKMLTDLDPSGKFRASFEQALKDGLLLSYEKVNSGDEDFVAYKENAEGKLETVNISKNFFSDYINLTSTDTLTDVVDLMDGFIHYYMANHHKNAIDDYKYVSEIIPAYYEARTCNWLAENGFDAVEVSRILNTRRADCLGTSKLDNTPLIIDLVAKKERDGELSIENILTEQQVLSHVNLRKARGIMTPDVEIIKKGYATNCAKMIAKTRSLNTEMIGYSLGYQLGRSNDLEEMDRRMTWVIDNCSNREYNATDLVNALRNGVSYKNSSTDELDTLFNDSVDEDFRHDANLKPVSK